MVRKAVGSGGSRAIWAVRSVAIAAQFFATYQTRRGKRFRKKTIRPPSGTQRLCFSLKKKADNPLAQHAQNSILKGLFMRRVSIVFLFRVLCATVSLAQSTFRGGMAASSPIPTEQSFQGQRLWPSMWQRASSRERSRLALATTRSPIFPSAMITSGWRLLDSRPLLSTSDSGPMGPPGDYGGSTQTLLARSDGGNGLKTTASCSQNRSFSRRFQGGHGEETRKA